MTTINKILRKIKYLLLKLLRIKDNAHRIARGFTIGLLINFIPTFGLGPVISTLSAKLIKANPLAGFIGGVSTIWAFPLFFYLNVLIGHLFFPIELSPIEEGLDNSEEAVEAGIQIGKAFLVGMFSNILLFGAITYLVVWIIIKKSRNKILRFIYENWRLKRI